MIVDAIAGTDDKTTRRVPRETYTRLKLVLGRIKCCGGSVYAELVPMRNAARSAVINRARIEEGVSMMGLVK